MPDASQLEAHELRKTLRWREESFRLPVGGWNKLTKDLELPPSDPRAPQHSAFGPLRSPGAGTLTIIPEDLDEDRLTNRFYLYDFEGPLCTLLFTDHIAVASRIECQWPRSLRSITEGLTATPLGISIEAIKEIVVRWKREADRAARQASSSRRRRGPQGPTTDLSDLAAEPRNGNQQDKEGNRQDEKGD